MFRVDLSVKDIIHQFKRKKQIISLHRNVFNIIEYYN